MNMTPLKLEVLMHFYCSSSPFPRRNAPAVIEALDYLEDYDMLSGSDEDGVFLVTERGAAYIKHILTIPFPVAQWIIPE